ncbi:MAG: radical SAM protein, partial [Bacteroidota bacterium]
LDVLPTMDYSEYFDLATKMGYPKSKIVLPVEASRGCAWEHRCKNEELNGCTFCGLYRNSPNYREKTINRIKKEIESLILTYKNLKLSFVDAYLPDSYKNELLEHLAELDFDVDIFCELRCDLDDKFGHLLATVPARKIQLGVESFQEDILKVMEKGRRLVDNVNSIKICQEYNLPFQYNLMLDYPGVKVESVIEMEKRLPLLFGLYPPTVSSFYLDRGSRMYMHPEEFGIDANSFDRIGYFFLPESFSGKALTQIVSYKEIKENLALKIAWKKVRMIAENWQKVHEKALFHGMNSALSYRNGRNFLLIDDYRDEGVKHYKIEGILKDVLLASQRKITKTQLLNCVNLNSMLDLEEVLSVLDHHKLILRDNRFIISLPIAFKHRHKMLCNDT